ncbi:hypothetical protein CY34DRAFT_142902 [Suillus luteus UH-Slu-Lm8-n1]|uniref:Uncharacterized protein n=1 Tax=Suillus luteus UH-Slu-Lm8-n1 TaxID=930992 RepID=A0A0C9ZTB7_9AGAM|nr:hypothetical protein CY34DRAFT_142902 [Suillus luteus UH-Slu-Lm8-n1]
MTRTTLLMTSSSSTVNHCAFPNPNEHVSLLAGQQVKARPCSQWSSLLWLRCPSISSPPSDRCLPC